MKGPFYVKENGKFDVCEKCKDCAWCTTEDAENAECYLIPCPFMSIESDPEFGEDTAPAE